MEVHEIRRNNLLQMFSEYVAKRMADDPSTQVRGLDKDFAALVQVNNTYFSGMKSGGRQIGDKLARQMETLCGKSKGWLDEAREEEKTTELAKFLKLAEKAYLTAPGARKDMTRAMREAIAVATPTK